MPARRVSIFIIQKTAQWNHDSCFCEAVYGAETDFDLFIYGWILICENAIKNDNFIIVSLI